MMSNAEPARRDPRTPEGFVFVRELGGIREYTLEANGLTVLIMENHTAPVATLMVTYRVGSRNETTGCTGSTHILEHLMFKGSENFNEGNSKPFWKIIEMVGAYNNAMTWHDGTCYYETIPVEHLNEAIAIEADRMRHATFKKSDLDTEMTVVRNEYEWRQENDADRIIMDRLWSVAYLAHPYHHSTIGWKSDIENSTVERLREFYDTFYWPNNATVSVLGDVDIAKTLESIKTHFGVHPHAPHDIPPMLTQEPIQEGPRRLIIRRALGKTIVGIGHKTPAGLHPDTPALMILAHVLGGSGTSRLYRKLVDTGLATSAGTMYAPRRDNALFETYISLAPGVKPEKVEKIVLAEYEKIKTDGIAEQELARTKTLVKASAAYDRDGTYIISERLTESITIGDWTAYITLPEAIDQVAGKDVQRVAQEYLVEDQSTTGWLVPKPESGSVEEEVATPIMPHHTT